ncbi:MAG TPA: chemotaxis protein CheX [Terracidiphilus sp.]|nr:chemotaxis protein CheX [Terracidiphilus sp.]
MPTGSTIEIHLGELAEIVQYVFRTMVGLEVSESSRSWIPGDEQLTATIHLAGEWKGALALECGRRQACAFAARFLAIEKPETVDDIVRDVLGELANMIGGNLKCVLAGGLRLSMPSVVDGADHNLRVCRAGFRERLVFDSVEGAFSVAVLREERKSVRIPLP